MNIANWRCFQIDRLIRKAQKGNDRAFLTLFQQYEAMIYRTAFLYVRNEHDALDVVQETAYRSFKAIENVREPKYFKTWLTRIAINVALDMVDKRKKVIPIETYFNNDANDTTEKNLELNMTLEEIMDHLTTDEKSVILLRFYYDLTIRKVAETLDIPLGTAKTILYRSLKKLRKHLKGDEMYE